METSTIILWALTNLIMLTGGYYLGAASEKEKAIKFVNKIVKGCAMYMAVNGDIKKLMKKEKNAKHAGRI